MKRIAIKKMLAITFATMLITGSLVTTAFAASNGSLDDAINSNKPAVTQSATTNNTPKTNTEPKTATKNSDFINGLNEASDLTANTEGANKVTVGLKKSVGFVVQVLSYGITILLALRVVLDLAFIGLPFLRSFLSNGYMGNAQAGGSNPQQGGMQGGMGGMGMGGMGGGRYGGMQGGMGGMQGGMGGMQGGMGGQQGQQQQPTGKVQWISNAALNSVAGETTVGPDGTAGSPFKIYIKDMLTVLIITPVLITLAVTGVLTNLGFAVGSLLVDAIRNLQGMM